MKLLLKYSCQKYVSLGVEVDLQSITVSHDLSAQEERGTVGEPVDQGLPWDTKRGTQGRRCFPCGRHPSGPERSGIPQGPNAAGSLGWQPATQPTVQETNSPQRQGRRQGWAQAPWGLAEPKCFPGTWAGVPGEGHQGE